MPLRRDNARHIQAPTGTELSCRSWSTEAAMRMLMNNLDPRVAEAPEELVVYGGIGRAARDWESFDSIVESLRRLEDDQTLLVQSGKPVGIFRTHRDAPRVLIGGNNAVTRPAAHGLALPLERVGLITLDAHFDLRETDSGPMNGNPVRCLLEDGLPGRNLVQIGLAPFANTKKMHDDAMATGAGTFTISECLEDGIFLTLEDAVERLGHVDSIIVDFDIDVIDRAQCPGAPGARPGGMPVQMFFDAARYLAADPRVKLVDLTEFDPSLDVGDITALTAARWVAEIAAGYAARA